MDHTIRVGTPLRSREEIGMESSSFMQAVESWESRCRSTMKSLQICTCNLFGGGSIEDLEAVAKILTAFFHHDVRYFS